jgi:hypothetical protein
MISERVVKGEEVILTNDDDLMVWSCPVGLKWKVLARISSQVDLDMYLDVSRDGWEGLKSNSH